MMHAVYALIQIIVIILAAPLVNGIIRKVKALTQKRKGAPLLQMYFDLFKLLKKSVVVSDVASWIFRAAPYIAIASAVAASLFVPVTAWPESQGYAGDMILFVSVLALGRFFMMLAALDTASTFGGMGSSREAMISALTEPSLLVTLFTVGLIAKSTSIFQIMHFTAGIGIPLLHPVYILGFAALCMIIIAETSRIPVDDPSTHLELTMVHEAMILEYSGRDLALMELSASIRQLVFITLLVNIYVPHDQMIALYGLSGFAAIAVSLLVYLIKVILVSIMIAVIEVHTVKLRLFSIPNLAALAFIVSFLGFIQYFVLGR